MKSGSMKINGNKIFRTLFMLLVSDFATACRLSYSCGAKAKYLYEQLCRCFNFLNFSNPVATGFNCGRYKSILPLLLIMAGCHRDTITCNGVPNVAVNFTLDLNQPTNANLLITGGYVVVTGGFDNVIVYRYIPNQFNAFDCCCPYDGANNTKAVVQLNSNKISVTCPVCGSTFNLSDGSVSKGPSKCSLKPYNTSTDGSTYVTVTN